VKLLLDINVLLDVLLNRQPWSAAAARVLAAIESNQAEASVAAHTLPTIYYAVAQSRDRKVAKAAVTDLLRILEVAPITKADFQRALELPVSDFEDAVQAAAALKIGADYFVTRNEKDFRAAPVATADPPTILALL
jgi:predicted nucleic acid-binding protein